MADSKGISIHLGLNAVDPAHYGGWNGTLTACEFDAKDMKAIAEARGFDSTLLLTKEATTTNFLTAMGKAESQLNEGDILFLTYSGHGGQVPDLNGDEAENARPDGKDETWALYDRQLVDDELYAQWAKLRSGVRVIMLSDSCHSGTMARELIFPAMVRATVVPGEVVEPTSDVTRLIPLEIQAKTYEQNKVLYDGLQRANSRGENVDVGASVILISGCQDNQSSMDGARNGLFTEALLRIWNDGKFKGGYKRFWREISRTMPASQSPNFFPVGVSSRPVERQRPFTVALPQPVPVAAPAR